MNGNETKKLGWKKDWPAFPYVFFATIGFAVSVYDFWRLQHLTFHLAFVIIGIILLVLGFALRYGTRIILMKKAGFHVMNSFMLQTFKDQRLITSGIYSHIRHPLYLGEMIRNIGYAVLFSSLYGLVLVIVANIFLLFRIEIEEKMLIAEFGPEYDEYKKKTKKLLPFIY